MDQSSHNDPDALAALPQLVRSHPPPFDVSARYASHPFAPRYSQNQHAPPPSAYYAEQRTYIDADALAAGVQRYMPSALTRLPQKFAAPGASSSYISLPPGIDPATVDFRAFYPYNPSEVKTRKRTTRSQLKVLEETFKKETKPSAALRKNLASRLEMTPRGVQVWFQNRRAKEKLLAKKALASTTKNSIKIDSNIDSYTDDVDSDVDHPEQSTVGGGDDDNMDNNGTLAHSAPSESSPDNASLLEHQASSTSPKGISPDSASPQLVAAIPHVTILPPENGDDAAVRSDLKIEADRNMDILKASDPRRSMWGTQTAPSNSASLVPNSISELYSRRPSLPTHLGMSLTRGRPGFHASPRLMPSNLGASVYSGGTDPNSRRMSFDRLAGHPYAQFAVHANTSRGGGMRYRPSLPPTSHGNTPTLTPQIQSSELPGMNVAGNNNSGGDPIALPEVPLPQIQPQAPFNATEMRSEFMHRQSLPAHLTSRSLMPASSQLSHPHTALPLAGATHEQVARPAHAYAFSTRTYQPPIAGPLPNPDFSFGSPSTMANEEARGAVSDNVVTDFSDLRSYRFPSLQPVKADPEGEAVGVGIDLDRSARAASHPSIYFHDMREPNPYPSRFGSIASVASIAESESAANFFENGGFDTQADNANANALSPDNFNNIRRPSCASNTNRVLDMFSNLGVNNNSTNSLPQPQEQQNDAQNRNSRMSISQSSELAHALLPHQQDDGSHASSFNVETSSVSDILPKDQSQRSSFSSSDFYPLTISTSATSSRSSLHVPEPQPSATLRVDTDKLDFMHNYDMISETGHYSPVSYPISFDFPITSSDAMDTIHSNMDASSSEPSLLGAAADPNSNNGLVSLPFGNHSMGSFQHMSQQYLG